MKKQIQVFLLIFVFLFEGVTFASTAPNELTCRELFIEPGFKNITTTDEKLDFLHEGILAETREAFTNYNILPLDRRGQKQLRRFLQKLNFEKIRSNDIFKISQIMSDRHAPLFGQIKLVLEGQFGKAKANIILNRLTNQLILMSLYKSFAKEERIKDLGLLTSYKINLSPHLVPARALAATVFSLYSIYTGITVGNFRGIVMPQLHLLKYKNLPLELQEHILDGIDKATPAVIAHSKRRITFETAYDIAYRSFYMVLTTATMAIIANMIMEKMFGYRAKDVFDDLFFRQALEKAAGDSLIDGLEAEGVEFDEPLIRMQVHEMSLKNLKMQAQD